MALTYNIVENYGAVITGSDPPATGALIIPDIINDSGTDQGVFAIADSAFSGNTDITSLSLGVYLNTIGASAFEGCTGLVGDLVLPVEITSVGAYAFKDCGYEGSLIIMRADWSGPPIVGTDAFTGTDFSDLTVDGNYIGGWSSCSWWTGNLVIGSGVTYIGEETFKGCSNFTGSLVIPDAVTSIDFGAFENCTGFTGSLVIPDAVTSIGTSAFNNCTGFTGSLTIGNGVTNIDGGAFNNCTGFTGSLTIGHGVTNIGGNAFNNCTGFTGSLTIPDSVTSISDLAFENCSGFTGSLTIGNGVTYMGFGVFNNCTGFTGSLTIPDSVLQLENSVFNNCTGFNGLLTIGFGVNTIGASTFNNCTGFTSVWWRPQFPPVVGSDAFSGVKIGFRIFGTNTGEYSLLTDPYISFVPITETDAAKVAEGTIYGIENRLVGTMKSGGGINGSGILGML